MLFTFFWSFVIDGLFIVDDFKFYGFCTFFIIGFIVVILGTVLFSSKDRVEIKEDNENNNIKNDNIEDNI